MLIRNFNHCWINRLFFPLYKVKEALLESSASFTRLFQLINLLRLDPQSACLVLSSQ